MKTCPKCHTQHNGILSICVDCSEAGYKQLQADRERERQIEREASWLAMCPATYRQTDLNRIHPICRQLAQSWTPGYQGRSSLLLPGVTGAGKTRASFAILRRFFEAGKSVYAVHAGSAWDIGEHVQGLGSAARLIHSDDSRIAEAARGCLSYARRCYLLLIDDLGKERTGDRGQVSEAVGEALFDLIESRLVHGLPTIVTTNLSGQDLQTRLGPDRGAPLLRRLSDDAFMPMIGTC